MVIDSHRLSQTGVPRYETQSNKSYGTAVILSSVFGCLGIQYFYLGRWVEGLVDVGLTIGWFVSLISGQVGWFILFLALDLGHAFVSTILLLTGNMRDGEGHRVCYPGQKLTPN